MAQLSFFVLQVMEIRSIGAVEQGERASEYRIVDQGRVSIRLDDLRATSRTAPQRLPHHQEAKGEAS